MCWGLNERVKWGLRFISVNRCCIYRSSQKRIPCPPSFPPLSSSLPHFQLAPDGWSKAIRSKYSSSGACSLSLPQTPHRHSSDRKVRTNSVQLLHLSIFPPLHSLHWSSFTMSSILHHTGILLSASPPTCSCSPSFHLQRIVTI